MNRRESPIRRVNPSGAIVWVARYSNSAGKRRSAGTFGLKRDAQAAIDRAYGRAERIETVGGYFTHWPRFHPRADRTQRTNEHRVTRALPVEIDGMPLREWTYADLRRRHALALVDVLLRDQGRSALGATHIIRALSIMTEDAITDEVAEVNPFSGVTIRANDPRVGKRPRRVRVFSFEQMHSFSRSAGRYEAMVRTFADTGMRLGEVLPLRREDFNGQAFEVRRTAHNGRTQEGTKTDHGEADAGRIVPCPPRLAELIKATPRRIDTALLYPTPTGKIWWERNFYRDVWSRAQRASGLDIRPHEMRHSYLTHLRAAGVDDADLAAMAGHTVQTMLGRYTHALGRSFDQVRDIIG
ncbi:MAG: site-specific integrase [Thermoleophilaceae bacterium]